ncbi:RodZ domain-containing protein [Thalassotalea maritima]|uniref:RodZ domain-containing protein n=1 Tax=Thalassotalea maritima TaxID=3242416 RepID=UPI003528992D
MSQDTDKTANDSDIQVIGPGRMLKDARNALNLSEDEVAHKLNLRPSLVEDIEADRIDPKTPKTFIRGYLRNYAKLVDVSEEEVISRYDSLTGNEPAAATMTSFSQGTRKRAENNRLMIAIYLIVAVLLALTVIWWAQQAASKKASNIEAATLPTTVLTADSNPDDASTTAQGNQARVEVVNTDVLNSQATAEDVGASIAQPATNTPASISTSIDQTTQSEETQDEVFEQHMGSVQQGSEPQVNNQTGQQQIIVDQLEAGTGHVVVMSFAGDCWVNIYDAAGERLAYGIKNQGYVLSVQGQPPINFTLGAPELVTLTIDGKPYDLSNYRKGQVAKFVWPAQEN